MTEPALVHEHCGGLVVDGFCQACEERACGDEVWPVPHGLEEFLVGTGGDTKRAETSWYRAVFNELRGAACDLELRLLGRADVCDRCRMPAVVHKNYAGVGR